MQPDRDVEKVLPYPPAQAEEKKTAYVGMTIFVAGWTMMFVSIFFVYLALRATSKGWPPVGLPEFPVLLPGLNTLVIIASSVVLELGLKQTRLRKTQYLAPSLGIAAGLGLLFLAIQYGIALDLYRAGLFLEGGAYAAIFYGLGAIHGAHVILGIFPLLFLAYRAQQGRYSAPRHLPVRMWAIYWHFVGIIWIFIYVLVFVI